MGVCAQQKVSQFLYSTKPVTPQPIAPLIYDSSRGKLYIFWAEATTPGGQYTTFFREFDLATETLGTPIQVESNTAVNSSPYVHATQLSDGTLICAYSMGGPGNGWRVRESSNYGITWSGATDFSVGDVEECIGFATRGTVCWMLSQVGSITQDIQRRVRLGSSSWQAPDVVFNGTFTNSWFFSLNAARPAVLFANGHACIVGDRYPASSSDRVHALHFDGASWSESTIHDYTPGDAQAREPVLIEGAGGRLWCFFVHVVVGPTYHAQVAYSDDEGVTWTFLGEPAGIPTPLAWDPDWSRAFAVDEVANNAFASTIDSSNHRVFRGNATPPWVDLDTCGPLFDNITYFQTDRCVGDGLFTHGDGNFWRLFTKVNVTTPELWILKHPSLGEVPPPPVDPGISTHRIYRRGTIQAVRLDDGTYAAAGLEEFPAAPNFGD